MICMAMRMWLLSLWRLWNEKPIDSLDNAQPGDLLFWGDTTNYWHVAIYAGNGTMISADSEASGINEEPLWGTPTLIKRY